MSQAAIDEQEDFASGAFDQAFQEFDEDSGIDAALAKAAIVEPDKRARPKDKPRALGVYVCAKRQSYQNVSRETFWYDPQDV